MTKPVEPMTRPLRVAFAGTPEFASKALEALIAAGYDVPLVLTQPDRPAGRGMKLQPSPVKQAAQSHGVTVQQPRSLKLDGRYPDDAQAAQAALLAAAPDVMVVAAYGLILPEWTLTLPRWGCLNIHASLLPRWRGAAPIHRAIEAGDAQTGITIMQMDAGLDTGDRLLEAVEPIRADDTTARLHDRLATLGAHLILEALAALRQGPLTAQPQPTEGVTYAHKIEKAESRIDWTQSAVQIERRVRAFDPFPGATLQWGDEVLKLWQARVVPSEPLTALGAELAQATPGTVLRADAHGVWIACGEGVLSLEQVQRPGSKRMAVAAWMQGQGGETPAKVS